MDYENFKNFKDKFKINFRKLRKIQENFEKILRKFREIFMKIYCKLKNCFE